MNELVIFDLDNTIVKGQSQRLFLSYVLKKGLITHFFYFKLMLWFLFYKLGLIEDPKKIMKSSFSFLKGQNVDDFREIINDFFEEKLKYYIFQDVVNIIKKHKTENRKILIVSNSIEFIPEVVSRFLGINYIIGTKLKQENNKFTGEIKGDIIYSKNKIIAINNFMKNNKLSFDNSYGYSDHHSDLPFLKMVSNPTAVNPSYKLKKEARKNKWLILLFKQTIK